MYYNSATVSVKDIYGSWEPKIPNGYQATNNFYVPKVNDTFLSPKGEVCTLFTGDVIPKGPRVILTKKVLSSSAYFITPKAPKGFTLGELVDMDEANPSTTKTVLGSDGKVYYGGYFSSPRYELIPTPSVVTNGFKVGDRVLHTSINKYATIDSFYPDNKSYVRLTFENNPGAPKDGWYLRFLVAAPKFTHSFKVGDKVTRKYSGTATVVEIKSDSIYLEFSNSKGWFTATDWKLAPPTTPKFKAGDRVVWAKDGKDTMDSVCFGKVLGPVVYRGKESYSVEFDKVKNGSQDHLASDLVIVPSIPGYEVVDFRTPKKGEKFYSSGEFVETALFDFVNLVRFIIKDKTPPPPPIPTVESVYGKNFIPKVPKGYELGKFTEMESRSGKFYLGTDTSVLTADCAGNEEYYRYELLPYPTTFSVYGNSTPTPPKGYKLGEFVKLMAGNFTWLPNEEDFLKRRAFKSEGYHTYVGVNAGTYRFLLEKLPSAKKWTVEVESQNYNTSAPDFEDTDIEDDWGTAFTVLSVTEKK